MSKGLALPVEYLIIIIIAIVVLLAVIAFFTGGLNWLFPMSIQAELGKACQVIRSNGCVSTPIDNNVVVPGANPSIDSDKNCVSQGMCDEDGTITIKEICYVAGLYDGTIADPWTPCLKACMCDLPTP